MTSTIRRLLLGASLAASMGLAGAALAQDEAGPPQGPPTEAHQGRAERVAQYAAELREALHLRADQQGALDEYLASMRPHRGDHRGRREGDEDQALTTPDRLDRMLARYDEHRARLVAMIEPTKRFYAQLTPEQRRAFDQMPPPGVGHHREGLGPRMLGPRGRDLEGGGRPGGDQQSGSDEQPRS